MKPTLYADDLAPDELHSERKYWMNARAALRVLRPILPKRCPGNAKGFRHLDTTEAGVCGFCSERDWLYPEMPDWWTDGNDPFWDALVDWEGASWEDFCKAMWRAMGILEDE